MKPIFLQILFTSLVICSCESTNSPALKLEKTNTQLPIDFTSLAIKYSKVQLEELPLLSIKDFKKYIATSGMVSKSPSKYYHNPSDSGIFVYYSLIDRENYQRSHDLSTFGVGSLIMHTYWKEPYGWSENDKDQDFIFLFLQNDAIPLKDDVRVGSDSKTLITSLGIPFIQSDTAIYYFGSNHVMAKFEMKNDKIITIKYGRFAIPDSILNSFKSDLKEFIYHTFD